MFSKTNMVVIVIVLTTIGGVFWYVRSKDDASSTATSTSEAGFDKSAQSTSDPASLWVVVNKKLPLPATYIPAGLGVPNTPLRLGASYPEMQLRSEAAKSAEELVAAAKNAGIPLMLVSGYRSYDSQEVIYNSNVAADGQTSADRYSARPGHSEHQTGLAADFGTTDRKCELEECFGQSAAGKWLVDNAAQFGYILRYDQNMQSKVGYDYEPWHFRYVGKELASEIKKTAQTLEEFFGLPDASSY